MGRILAHAGTAPEAATAAATATPSTAFDSLGDDETTVMRPPSPTPSANSNSTRSAGSAGSSNSRGSKRSFSMANVGPSQFCIAGFNAPNAPNPPSSAAGFGSAGARPKRTRASDADDPLCDRRGGRVVAGGGPVILASLSLARIPRLNGPLI